MKLVAVLVVLCGSFFLTSGNFIACDLDLEDPAILAQLPQECQNLDESSSQLMKQEAISFKTFHNKLLEYEAVQGKHTEDEMYMDMDFRRRLYERVDIDSCSIIAEPLEEHIKCLIEKRQQMIDIIGASVVNLR
ncbi:uncharacterized protein LOC126575575 [Anopheles aquasalis]|uniref:uncharacterized protein LOC126575575 n=1 Tax=Anopheles aquasalis TaxID=42839 RepID=UPI00215AD2F9|nr:uncharacterized protein LOC126575575 [Anopheles aquasalis]